MDTRARDRLQAGSRDLGVPLSDDQVTSLSRYADLLRHWNQRINLTAIDDDLAIVERHFLDCIAVQPHVAPAKTMLDVGSGAGFPGLVLALLNPALEVTCIESIHKKVSFLREVSRTLGLLASILPIRLEAYEGPPVDLAISRATFEPSEWVAVGARLIAPGGRLIAMLGAERPNLPTPPGFRALPLIESPSRVGSRALAVFSRETFHVEH